MEVCVRTADENCIKAIKDLLRDYEAEFKVYDYTLSNQDSKNLQEIYDKNQKDELEFIEADKFWAEIDEHLEKLDKKYENNLQRIR